MKRLYWETSAPRTRAKTRMRGNMEDGFQLKLTCNSVKNPGNLPMVSYSSTLVFLFPLCFYIYKSLVGLTHFFCKLLACKKMASQRGGAEIRAHQRCLMKGCTAWEFQNGFCRQHVKQASTDPSALVKGRRALGFVEGLI